MGRERLITGFHMQTQRHRSPGRGPEAVANFTQISCHESKQIGRLREGVLPGHGMAIGSNLLLRHGIAIAQQHGATGLGCFNPHRPAAEHIRTIGMEGDSPEALRLALGAEQPSTGVQPLEGTVAVRIDATAGLQHKGLGRRCRDGQQTAVVTVGAFIQGLAIDRDGVNLQIHPLQMQRCS